MKDEQVDRIIAKLEEIRCQEIDVEEAIKLLESHIIERLTVPKPAPAPDLDALADKYATKINNGEPIRCTLLDFAAELKP